MNTSTTYDTSGTNVSRNERVFRAVACVGIVAAITSGAIAAPAALFAASLIAVYLMMTSILGMDPHYAAWNMLTKTAAAGRGRVMAA